MIGRLVDKQKAVLTGEKRRKLCLGAFSARERAERPPENFRVRADEEKLAFQASSFRIPDGVRTGCRP